MDSWNPTHPLMLLVMQKDSGSERVTIGMYICVLVKRIHDPPPENNPVARLSIGRLNGCAEGQTLKFILQIFLSYYVN